MANLGVMWITAFVCLCCISVIQGGALQPTGKHVTPVETPEPSDKTSKKSNSRWFDKSDSWEYETESSEGNRIGRGWDSDSWEFEGNRIGSAKSNRGRDSDWSSDSWEYYEDDSVENGIKANGRSNTINRNSPLRSDFRRGSDSNEWSDESWDRDSVEVSRRRFIARNNKGGRRRLIARNGLGDDSDNGRDSDFGRDSDNGRDSDENGRRRLIARKGLGGDSDNGRDSDFGRDSDNGRDSDENGRRRLIARNGLGGDSDNGRDSDWWDSDSVESGRRRIISRNGGDSDGNGQRRATGKRNIISRDSSDWFSDESNEGYWDNSDENGGNGMTKRNNFIKRTRGKFADSDRSDWFSDESDGYYEGYNEDSNDLWDSDSFENFRGRGANRNTGIKLAESRDDWSDSDGDGGWFSNRRAAKIIGKLKSSIGSDSEQDDDNRQVPGVTFLGKGDDN